MALQTPGKYQSNYTARQVRNVLTDIGIKIEGETYNDFLCLCPYHSNKDTPALSVSLSKGTFLCFSPQCGESGNLLKLVMDQTRSNEFSARRLIIKHGVANAETFHDDLSKILMKEPQFTEFDPKIISVLQENMWSQPGGRNYMYTRGFNDNTIKQFGVGYSAKMSMVTIPVKTPQGMIIGFIGRSIEGKEFKNSSGLLKSETLFNIDQARKNSTAYVCEASFDAMRLVQAGYPGAVAIAGGNISERQLHLLNMYFDTIVIMTDFDDKARHVVDLCRKCMPYKCKGHNPGRMLGNRIAEKLSSKNIQWGVWDYGKLVYPPGCKDVSDMTDDQIKTVIENASPNFIYQQWAPT